jgi:hypothetical protein
MMRTMKHSCIILSNLDFQNLIQNNKSSFEESLEYISMNQGAYLLPAARVILFELR